MSHARRKLPQLRVLADLMNTAFQAKQVEVEGYRTRLQRVEAMIADLDHAVAQRNATRGQQPDAALRAGADVGWMVWIEQRKTLLNTERVRLINEIADRQTDLARAFGRKEIAAKVHQKASRRPRG